MVEGEGRLPWWLVGEQILKQERLDGDEHDGSETRPAEERKEKQGMISEKV